MKKYLIFSLLLLITLTNRMYSQNQFADSTVNQIDSVEHKSIFKDSLDGGFDLSKYILQLHGFIPVPAIITEPALGGFGGALGAVFLSERKKHPQHTHSPKFPSTTVLGAMYTLNNSWGAGGGHISSIDAINADYRLVAAYANINMNFYNTSKITGEEHKMLINIETIPVFGMLGFDFLDYFNGGLEYTFMRTTLKPEDIDIPLVDSLLSSKKWTNNTSKINLFLRFDNRDNVFTPNNGIKIDTRFDWSDEAIGSDFNYTQVNAALYGYKTILDGWVGGLRLDYEQAFNNPPFYLLPYIDARGIPSARYQGKISLLAEMEHRIRIYHRWSAIGFVGLGKAFDDYDDFDDSKLICNYGVGFRYMIARLLNLHMGADFGFGPDSWAFYIVFGSAWLR